MTDTSSLSVGLIDPSRLRCDCVTVLFREAGIAGTAFNSVAECIENATKFDVLLYFPNIDDGLNGLLARIATLSELGLPIVVAAAIDSSDIGFLRNLLAAGVRGYISTRTTDVAATLTALRFVRDGGTFMPMERLVANEDTPLSPLTPRQMNVLQLLRLGKPNKIIAHELGMSESTTKVHVRNIMRRIGASNRTMAVYKAGEVLALAA